MGALIWDEKWVVLIHNFFPLSNQNVAGYIRDQCCHLQVWRINSEGEVKIAASTKYSQLNWDGDGLARAAETRKTSSLCRSFWRPRNRTRIRVHAVDEKRGVQFFMLLFFLLYSFLQRPRASDSTKHGWNAALPFARLDPQLSTNIWDFSIFAGLCLQRHSPTSAAQSSLSHRAQ